MSVSETFDRKFNKSMRGYNTEEVDAALDALLRYCDELEDANREFEIANNDLIDDKSELNKRINELCSEKEALGKQIAELTERVAHVEGLYNSYREKFGEARDMITKAKSSSSEIIARAQAKAEIISEEAAEKHKAAMLDFERETEKRRALIEKLDICYNEFSDMLKKELASMLDRVDAFAVTPILPDGLPEKRLVLNAADAVRDEDDEEITPLSDLDSRLNASEEEAETAEEVETVEEPKMIPYDTFEIDTEADAYTAPVFETGSKMSDMKSSLDAINQKVLKKKSTPHI